MRKKNVNPGDIVLIPTGGEKFAVGKILYLSHHYKDVILLGVYNIAVTEKIMPSRLPDAMPLILYAGQKATKQGRWIAVGHEPLKENQRGLAKRIVAGNVWFEDDMLRPATDDDYKSLSQMDVHGAALVEEKAGELIAKGISK